MTNYPRIYTRYLPHIQPEEGTFAITYRLYGSLPVPFIQQKKAEYEEAQKVIRVKYADKPDLDEQLLKLKQTQFKDFDDFLDKNPNEPYHLKRREIAKIVSDSLHFLAEKYYELHAFCIMSNHVHVLLTVKPDAPTLTYILERHKSYTGWQANKILGKTGSFWAEGSYDHLVRNEISFFRYFLYTLNNPVKANLVSNWNDWKFSYCNPNLLGYLADEQRIPPL